MDKRPIRKDGKIIVSYTRTVYSYCPYRIKQYIDNKPYITTTQESDYGIEEHKNIENSVILQDLSNYPALEKFLSNTSKYTAEKEYYYEDEDLNVVIHVKPDIIAYKYGKIVVIDNKTSYRIDNEKYKLQLFLYAYSIANLFNRETEARIYYTRYDYLTSPIVSVKTGDKLPSKIVDDIIRTEIVLKNIENNKEAKPIAGIWCKQCNYIMQCPLASPDEKRLKEISNKEIVNQIIFLKRKISIYEDELLERLEKVGEIKEETPLGTLKAKYSVRKRNMQDKEKIYEKIKDRDDFLSYINSFSIVKVRKLIKNGILEPDVIKTELRTIKEIDIKIENEEVDDEEE